MPVYACPFIKPAFFHRGVNAHGDDVLSPVIQIVADIITETRVAAVFGAEIESIHPHYAIPEHAFKCDGNAFARVGFGERESLSVPADAVFREGPPHCPVPVAGTPA